MITRAVARATDLQVAQLEDLTAHYALTLRHWRRRLHDAQDRLRMLGRDEVFQRCWDFYFAYCEGGFLERRIGSVQTLLVKPRCRELPALLPLAAPVAADAPGLRSREAADG